MAFCFSHMLYLSLGTEVAREGKKKKKTAVTAITYMYISYVLTSGQQCISELSIKIHQFCWVGIWDMIISGYYFSYDAEKKILKKMSNLVELS